MTFKEELEELINKHSLENKSDTPPMFHPHPNCNACAGDGFIYEIVDNEKKQVPCPLCCRQPHPDPPLRCLAIAEGHKYPHWWILPRGFEWWWCEESANGNAETHELTVVPDPRNDPEAVAMIEASKRNA